MFQCQADRSRIIISTRGIMEENRMRRASIVNQFFSRRDAAQLRIRYNKSSPDRFEELRERLYPTIDNGLMNFHVCTFGFWNSERIRINYTYVIRARGSSTHIRYKIRTRLSVTVYLADTVENSRPRKLSLSLIVRRIGIGCIVSILFQEPPHAEIHCNQVNTQGERYNDERADPWVSYCNLL